MLAGLVDAHRGALELPRPELDAALTAAEAEWQRSFQQLSDIPAQLAPDGESWTRFLQLFRQMAEVQRSRLLVLHSSSEGKVLEDPWIEPPEYVHMRTISPMDAPDKATEITVSFKNGDAVAINGREMSPASLLGVLNELGHDNGIGRIDLVENRFVGMKSRGVYETPGGTILLAAHRAIESITLDRGAGHLKDELMPRYAELIYNGFWFSPERQMLQALIDKSQEDVEGDVRLKLYKGNVIVTGRRSPKSLYSDALVTFEDDRGAYDQKDAEGFIRLNALRLRTLAARNRNP